MPQSRLQTKLFLFSARRFNDLRLVFVVPKMWSTAKGVDLCPDNNSRV